MKQLRTKYLINPKYQIAMALGVIISVIAYSLVFSVIVFFPLYTEMTTASSIPELIRASSIAIFLHKAFWPGVFAVALMAGIHILFFSHRTVGPIYRFEKQLEALRNGDYSSRVHLRKRDEFENMEGLLNELGENLEQARSHDKVFINKLKAQLESLQTSLQNQGAFSKEAEEITNDMIKEISSR
jgi:signal transduction histidine kinase